MDSGVPAQMLMGCFDRMPLDAPPEARAGQTTSLPVQRSGGTGLGCRRVPLLLVTEGSAGEGVLRVEAVSSCKHCELCENVTFRRVGSPFTRLVRQFCVETCTNVTRVVNLTPTRLLSQESFQNVKDVTASHVAWPA
jgi:hypothetical protein